MYWNCFVFDKTMAEETGRPDTLQSRRSTVPLPSTHEADEFEFWPPPAARPVQSVQNIRPTRGHILTCFNNTCRLALIVEETLVMDADGPYLDGLPAPSAAPIVTAEMILSKLDRWYASLPPYLLVDPDAEACPPPHFVTNLAVSLWMYLS